MKPFQKSNALLCYWEANPRKGHTHTMIHGLHSANASGGAIVVVENEQQTRDIAAHLEPGTDATFISINNLDRLHGSHHRPLAIDHFALRNLLQGMHFEMGRVNGVVSDQRKQLDVSSREIASLRVLHDRWYQSYDSLVFTPPGEIPQTRGSFTEGEPLIEMATHLRQEYGAELKILVVSSRCGEVCVGDYDEWLQMREVGIECAKEEAAYIAAGICSQCGACSLKEARSKCRPSPLGDTGDFSCDGEQLWNDQREHEDDEDSTPDPEST